MCYRVVKKSWQYVQPFWYSTSVCRTDGRTDVQPISITCFSIADARKNAYMAYGILLLAATCRSYWGIKIRLLNRSRPRNLRLSGAIFTKFATHNLRRKRHPRANFEHDRCRRSAGQKVNRVFVPRVYCVTPSSSYYRQQSHMILMPKSCFGEHTMLIVNIFF